MSNTKRENWGSLRKLPSGRWQARYPGPDGTTYTARTDQDRPLTFLTKIWDASTVAALDAIVTKYEKHGKSVEIIGMNKATTEFHSRLSGGLGAGH